MQDCRIRWGTVESVDADHAVVRSQPLTFDGCALALGEPISQSVRWREDGVSLIASLSPGDLVAAHWDWICGTLSDKECADLSAATHATLALVNSQRISGGRPR
jgi:hypothetical protein